MAERLPITRRGPLATDGIELRLRFKAISSSTFVLAQEQMNAWLEGIPDGMLCDTRYEHESNGCAVILILYYEPIKVKK